MLLKDFVELEGKEIDLSDLDDSYEEDLDDMTAGQTQPGEEELV